MSEIKKEKKVKQIPMIFESKELCVGKCNFKGAMSEYKFSTSQETKTILEKNKSKEFILENKSNDRLVYKGRTQNQDSNYIIMQYNPKLHCIQLFPANKWVNFTQSMKVKEKTLEEIEEMKKKRKEEETGKGRKKKQKKEGNDDEDEEEEEKKTKKKIEKEDSYSSENDPNLADDDSYEDRKEKEERLKKMLEEEKKLKKLESEAKKNKKKEGESEGEEDNEDDDDDEEEDLNMDNSEEASKDDVINILGKKTKRTSNIKEEMGEELVNLLLKMNRMTYDEIVTELKKKFKEKDIEENIDEIIEAYTSNFSEGEKTYYYKKN